MLYPDGMYFADEDGFGMESNNEETVYAIIDTNLNIVEPFRPIKNISTYLEEIRKNKRKSVINKWTMMTRWSKFQPCQKLNGVITVNLKKLINFARNKF